MKAQTVLPAERMKMREAHLAPLAPSAVKIPRALASFISNCTAPSTRPARAEILRKEGEQRYDDARCWKVENATLHGFRSTFTDWVAECASLPEEVQISVGADGPERHRSRLPTDRLLQPPSGSDERLAGLPGRIATALLGRDRRKLVMVTLRRSPPMINAGTKQF